MEVLLRAVAILIEVLILALLAGTLLAGAWLTFFDLGLGQRYRKMVATVLLLAGGMALVFFIAHLISFYPPV